MHSPYRDHWATLSLSDSLFGDELFGDFDDFFVFFGESGLFPASVCEPADGDGGGEDVGDGEGPPESFGVEGGVFGEDVGQGELEHPLGDEGDDHGDEHVAGGAEGGDDAELYADAAPGEAHDADEARALGDDFGIGGHEEGHDEGRGDPGGAPHEG